jgi:uncharacterized protein YjiS (DUF1127 family)
MKEIGTGRGERKAALRAADWRGRRLARPVLDTRGQRRLALSYAFHIRRLRHRQTSPSRRPALIAAYILTKWSRWRSYRRHLRQLRTLTDHELHDLGLRRRELRNFVRERMT